MAPSSNGEYRVDFTAGRVEVGAKLDELNLADDVVVVVDRYRLTSDELRLTRSPQGIVVDGDGQVAFCRCPEPPVSVGFTGATVAPPTDLLIENPTLRVGGVPVFWLPYLWLRAPDRLGLLPPRVAYSSEDGFLAGSGVHVPIDKSTFVDLEAAGYFEGGVDTGLRLLSPRNNVRVRFDHLEESMLQIDARGVAHMPGFSTAAYRVDLLRGARAEAATPALLTQAQRYDRARAEVGRHHGFAYYAAGTSFTAERGGPFDDFGALGPELVLGVGEALAGIGEVQSEARLQTLDVEGLGGVTRFEQRGTARLHARPGPVALELELGQRMSLESSASGSESAVAAGSYAEASLPLRRRFAATGPGLNGDPLVHYLSPLLSATFERSLLRGELGEVDAAPSDIGQLSAGARTSIGRFGQGSSLNLEGRAGWVRNETMVSRVAALELLAQRPALGASIKVVSELDGAKGWATTSRVRVGPEYGHHVIAYAEGQRSLDAVSGRLMSGDVLSNEPRVTWYDAPGLSAGAELGLNWTKWLSNALAGDYDLEARELMGLRGALAYRHPCGCLSTVAWAGHRLGRRGVDAWLTVDLIP